MKTKQITRIQDITYYLESLAPSFYQEPYDNSGLLIGNIHDELKGILICLDSTEKVIDEAIQQNCNLIIAHHPILFKGIKQLTGKNHIEKAIIKAIKNDIAIYVMHTNLDAMHNGVSFQLAKQLELSNCRTLSPKKNCLKKITVFVPHDHTLKVMNALHEAGGGHIGNYKNCSFYTEGTGTFQPLDHAKPFIGVINELTNVKENKLEIVFPYYLESNIIRVLHKVHPYETPAYDIISLDNYHPNVGLGAIGFLKEPLKKTAFLNHVQHCLDLQCIRYTPFIKEQITSVAVCGGAGSFLLSTAIEQQADVFITADVKYHEFFEANDKITMLDIGHYESEIATKQLIYDLLMQKFTNIALVLSKTNTNPIITYY